MYFKCKECSKLSKAEAWDESTRGLFGYNTISITYAYASNDLGEYFFLCPNCLAKDVIPEPVTSELKCNLQEAINRNKLPEAV